MHSYQYSHGIYPTTVYFRAETKGACGRIFPPIFLVKGSDAFTMASLTVSQDTSL